MNVKSKIRISIAINLVVVSLVIVGYFVAGMTEFFEFDTALFVAFGLTANTLLMLWSYKKGKEAFAWISFFGNLIIPMSIPVYRIIGTNFREGYIETLVITLPLLLLVIWNRSLTRYVSIPN